MKGSLDCYLQARLKREEHVLVVHVDDREMHAFNKVLFLHNEVALNDSVHRDQHYQVSVEDVAA